MLTKHGMLWRKHVTNTFGIKPSFNLVTASGKGLVESFCSSPCGARYFFRSDCCMIVIECTTFYRSGPTNIQRRILVSFSIVVPVLSSSSLLNRTENYFLYHIFREWCHFGKALFTIILYSSQSLRSS